MINRTTENTGKKDNRTNDPTTENTGKKDDCTIEPVINPRRTEMCREHYRQSFKQKIIRFM